MAREEMVLSEEDMVHEGEKKTVQEGGNGGHEEGAMALDAEDIFCCKEDGFFNFFFFSMVKLRRWCQKKTSG